MERYLKDEPKLQSYKKLPTELDTAPWNLFRAPSISWTTSTGTSAQFDPPIKMEDYADIYKPLVYLLSNFHRENISLSVTTSSDERDPLCLDDIKFSPGDHNDSGRDRDLLDRHLDSLSMSSASSACSALSWDSSPSLSCTALILKKEPSEDLEEDEEHEEIEEEEDSGCESEGQILTPPSSPGSGQGHSNSSHSSSGSSMLDVHNLNLHGTGGRSAIVRVTTGNAQGVARLISVTANGFPAVAGTQHAHAGTTATTTTVANRHHARSNEHSPPDTKRRIHKCQFPGCKKGDPPVGGTAVPDDGLPRHVRRLAVGRLSRDIYGEKGVKAHCALEFLSEWVLSRCGGERKEGRKDRKREISNYRDFPFWNSIPNVIVLASRAADRTLILRRCEIASPGTLNSPSLHSGKWIVNIYEKERFYPFFEFTRQSHDFVQEMKHLAFFGLKEKNIYSEQKPLLICNV
ncbi:hypothetical protein ALC60_01796 [Trachymyrmex zeteki]|uniref:Uncharacterized protein n=1 Tax=Mycetomoellerius zeteki TaxID=64791 RepID=A0A151XG03_9HYME|nr:hypothetical protein ALC60_01796 [Trachymyrmex zeteki]